jgi:hypothetical protein
VSIFREARLPTISAFFGIVIICDGVVVWPNGVDIAPDAMHDEVNGHKSGIAA